MWKWNLAVVAIVVVGIVVMFSILRGLPQIDEYYALPSLETDTGDTGESQPLQNSTPDELLVTSATIPVTINGQIFRASLANTPQSRQQGLSNTTLLPPDIVKLFVFDTNDKWGIWMKDMNYSIDIIWLDEKQTVVHLEENVAPESYPFVYTPPVPNRYVIEGVAGLIAQTDLVVGEEVTFTVAE
jgi:uncharacterized membrane protein (UPF0127 family)